MYQILLALHITAGFTAFSTGILAMLAAKGKKGHNSSGIIFVFAMFTVATTAFAMSLMKLNLFLFMIAGFSMYMTFTGYRFLKIRRMKTPGVGKYDWMATLSGFLTLLVPTIIILFNFSNTYKGTLIVYTVFGAIMSIMIFQDIQVYRKISRQSKFDLLAIHVARMVGAFIAASTAFLVLNWQSDPIWIAWLLPTFIFSPVIAYHQRKVKKAKPGTRVA